MTDEQVNNLWYWAIAAVLIVLALWIINDAFGSVRVYDVTTTTTIRVIEPNMIDPNEREELIRAWGKSGDVCKVWGHSYPAVIEPVNLEHSTVAWFCTCKICGSTVDYTKPSQF